MDPFSKREYVSTRAKCDIPIDEYEKVVSDGKSRVDYR